jgi:membrane fusion protein, multidrug efflux system
MRSFFVRFMLFVLTFLNGVNAQASAQSGLPIAVNVIRVAKMNIPHQVGSLGQLEAIKIATLSAESSGRISSINFKSGTEVTKGEPIVQLDDSITKTDYEVAKTALNLAQRHYQAVKKIAKYISAEQLNSVAADVKTKQALLNSAYAAMQDCKVLAPFSGRLGKFKFSEADYVSAGEPIVTLVNSDQLRVVYSLPDTYVNQLKSGQSVNISISQFPGRVFIGTVDYIAPVIDADTRSIELHALLPNPEVSQKLSQHSKYLLSPGMSVSVQQDVSVVKNALVVPNIAVSTDLHGNYVYEIRQGKAYRVYVKEGSHVKDKVQLLSGVKFDDEVVVAGQQKLDNGVAVKVLANKQVKS